jgi:hypothetical protein
MGAVPLARILEACFWSFVIIGLVLTLANSTAGSEHYKTAVAIGVAVTLFGVRAFLGDGGGRITALGLFNLSTSLFVGFGAIYAGNTEDIRVTGLYLALATLAVFVPQVAVTVVSWDKARSVIVQFPEVQDSRWLTRWGFLALILAAVVKYAGAPASLDPYIEATAFTAISVVAVGLYWRAKTRIISWTTVTVAALAVIYAEVFHIGSGRLRIVALLCAVGVVVTARFQRKALKWMTVGAIPPALWWLAEDRKEMQESLQAGGSQGRTGLESMLEPIIVFGKLIQSHFEAGFALSYGQNLLSYPFAFIPESWFPDAPQALGYELVLIWAPDKYGSGYSVVATNSGEAYYNFGWFGLVLIVPALVILLRLVDQQMVKRMSASTVGLAALLWIVFWAMLAGGISDFTWSGQHTFLTRASTRLPLLGLLVVFAALHAKLGHKKPKFAGGIAHIESPRKRLPADVATRFP